MNDDVADFAALVGPALAGALEKKGFTSLMPVQLAVLDPALAGRDLRVSSQTGSGKTIAIGLTLRELAEGPAPAVSGVARPRAMIVVPTRELSKQVHDELTWLYAPMHARVASATGGSDAREERRSFSAGPAFVVGTPGRLLDHLNRGSIDASQVGAVVLDEADHMLDLGFREDLEAILKFAPPGHRTHLVSATFPHDVRALADRVQKDPARIEATPLGSANADIDHVVHLVANHDRYAAIVNLLLSTPGTQTLIFARTRADVADITRQLSEDGFDVRSLSGEMEQRERNLALAAFKRGTLDALVATDVAARGIDVQDVTRVVHAEPPTDADSYTHRSGRTGRAGKKGTSHVLALPAGLPRTSAMLRRTGVRFRIEPIPSAHGIRRAADDRLIAELTEEPSAPDSEAGKADEARAPEPDARTLALAARLAEGADVVRAIARLLARVRRAGPEPMDVRNIEAPTDRERAMRPLPNARTMRDDRGPRDRGPSEGRSGPRDIMRDGPRDIMRDAPRDTMREGPRDTMRDGPRETLRDGPPRERRGGTWVPFRFTWGREHGADPRRLMAMACRRGGVQAGDIGAITVARTHSIVEIAASVADTFARAAEEHDPRDPRVTIRPEGAAPSARPHTTPPPRDDEPRDADDETEPRAKKEHVPRATPSKPGAAPPDRPSRSKVAAPPDRPSRSKVVAPDRPSRPKVVAPDRPSRPKAVTPDRPSRPKAHAPEKAPNRPRIYTPEKPHRPKVVTPDRPSRPKAHTPDRPSSPRGGSAPPKRKGH